MSQEQRRIQAVIFDLDDTLIDWSQPELTWDEFTRPMTDNIHAYLTSAGHSLPAPDEFYRCMREEVEREWDQAREHWQGASFSSALGRTLRICEIDDAQVDMEEAMRAYEWGPMPGVELYEDTLEVLAQLRDRGYKLGLITNSFLPMWMRDVELRHYNLIDVFDERTTSGDAGYIKPHPAIYHQMLERLQVPPKRAVFVGDRPQNDIAGANEAGMISILIDPPHLNREVNEHVPDFTIVKLSELIDVLERLEIGDS